MATMIWFSVFKANCHLSKLFRASAIPSAIQERTSGIRSCTQSWWQGIRLHWEIILFGTFCTKCLHLIIGCTYFFRVPDFQKTSKTHFGRWFIFVSWRTPKNPSKINPHPRWWLTSPICEKYVSNWIFQKPVKNRPWTIEDPLSIEWLLPKVMLGIYGFYFCPLDRIPDI